MRDYHFLFEDNIAVFEGHADAVSGGKFPGENVPSEGVEHVPLDGSLERPRAELRVKPHVRNMVPGGFVENNIHALFGEA